MPTGPPIPTVKAVGEGARGERRCAFGEVPGGVDGLVGVRREAVVGVPHATVLPNPRSPVALPPPSLKPQQNQTELVSGQNRCAENENTAVQCKRSEGTRARTRGSDGGGDRGRGSGGGGGDRETPWIGAWRWNWEAGWRFRIRRRSADSLMS